MSAPETSRRRFVLPAAAGFLVLKAPGKAAEFEFRCASALAADHPSTVTAKQMFAAIQRETGGRVAIQMFPNGSLGSDAALIQQLLLGALQFWVGFAYLPAVVPAVEITQVGFSFKDESEALHAIDGPLGEFLRRELLAKNLYTLRPFWGNGMRQITSSSRPIRTADDLAGFKIRVVPSRIVVDLFKTLGANPTSFGLNELYMALQTKVVDGEDSPLANMETARYFEVQKYLSLTNHNWAGLAMITSIGFWNKLPSDIRDTIERNNVKYAAGERRGMTLLNAAVADKFKRRGIPVNAADQASFRARLKPYYATWAKEFGPTAWGLLEDSIEGKLT